MKEKEKKKKLTKDRCHGVYAGEDGGDSDKVFGERVDLTGEFFNGKR